MSLKNKKAQDLLTGTTIFLVLNILFFGIMLLFVSQAGTGAEFIEKASAKQIATSIDGMRAGTDVTLYIPKLFDIAELNKLSEDLVSVDYEAGALTVRARNGKGYSYYFFTEIKSISWDSSKKIILIHS